MTQHQSTDKALTDMNEAMSALMEAFFGKDTIVATMNILFTDYVGSEQSDQPAADHGGAAVVGGGSAPWCLAWTKTNSSMSFLILQSQTQGFMVISGRTCRVSAPRLIHSLLSGWASQTDCQW